MSWFSELTGKAGAFLDKMDQAAASSLHEAGIATPSKSASVRETPDTSTSVFVKGVGSTPYEPTTTASTSSYQSLNSPKERGAAVAQVLVGSASGSAQLTSTPKSAGAIKPAVSTSGIGGTTAAKSERRKMTTDDSIFEFLNAPNTTTSGGSSSSSSSTSISGVGKKAGKQRAKQSPSSSRPHSAGSQGSIEEKPRPISTTPVRKQPPVQEGTWRTDSPFSFPSSRAEGSAKDSPDTVAVVEEGKNEPKETKAASKEKETVDGNAIQENTSPDRNSPPPTAEVSPDDQKSEGAVGGGSLEAKLEELRKKEAELEEWRQKVSSLNLENKLLKREVSSLNEEMSTATSRMEEATNSKDHYESKIHALREQASRSDHMIRQLRSQEEDLQALMVARDSQIEVLRTQLSAVDKALDEANEKLALSKKEQER